MTDDEIIDHITSRRSQNNLNWMTIIRIALKYAPRETRTVLADIQAIDTDVGLLTLRLAANEDREQGNRS